MLAEGRWVAVQRVEAWAGEVRVNAIRLVAITALYGSHLVNRYLIGLELPAGYHATVTSVAVAWGVGALALHLALARRTVPASLPYGAVLLDVLMITVLLLVSDGPRSPLVALLFLLIATSPLRLDLRLVWTSTALAALSYAVSCGHARWVRPEWQVPHQQQMIVAICLACAGLLAGQAVRTARRLVRGES